MRVLRILRCSGSGWLLSSRGQVSTVYPSFGMQNTTRAQSLTFRRDVSGERTHRQTPPTHRIRMCRIERLQGIVHEKLRDAELVRLDPFHYTPRQFVRAVSV